jgi:hypothetical protein
MSNNLNNKMNTTLFCPDWCSKIFMYFNVERQIVAVTGNLCLVRHVLLTLTYIGPEGDTHRK